MVKHIKYPVLFKDNNIKESHNLDFKNRSTESVEKSSENNSDLTDSKNIYDSEYSQDCSNYNKLPHILPAKKRIIAIGDLHGDYKLTLDCLKIAKVIDDKLKWKQFSLNIAEISSLRNEGFISYGSCSFDEPREDLTNLGMF